MIYLLKHGWIFHGYVSHNQVVILPLTTIKKLDRAYLTDQPVDPEGPTSKYPSSGGTVQCKAILVAGIPTPLKNDGVRQLGLCYSQLNGKS